MDYIPSKITIINYDDEIIQLNNELEEFIYKQNELPGLLKITSWDEMQFKDNNLYKLLSSDKHIKTFIPQYQMNKEFILNILQQSRFLNIDYEDAQILIQNFFDQDIYNIDQNEIINPLSMNGYYNGDSNQNLNFLIINEEEEDNINAEKYIMLSDELNKNIEEENEFDTNSILSEGFSDEEENKMIDIENRINESEKEEKKNEEKIIENKINEEKIEKKDFIKPVESKPIKDVDEQKEDKNFKQEIGVNNSQKNIVVNKKSSVISQYKTSQLEQIYNGYKPEEDIHIRMEKKKEEINDFLFNNISFDYNKEVVIMEFLKEHNIDFQAEFFEYQKEYGKKFFSDDLINKWYKQIMTIKKKRSVDLKPSLFIIVMVLYGFEFLMQKLKIEGFENLHKEIKMDNIPENLLSTKMYLDNKFSDLPSNPLFDILLFIIGVYTKKKTGINLL